MVIHRVVNKARSRRQPSHSAEISMLVKRIFFGRRRAVSPAVVQATAYDLVGRFGERSTAVANHQALKARRPDDGLGVMAWPWIARATIGILRCGPGELTLGWARRVAPAAS